MSRIKDLSGQRFGRLLVRKQSGLNRKNYALWLCDCDCGKTSIVASAELKKGRTNSCGCIRREVAGNRFKTHDMSSTPTFKSWLSAKDRCFNIKHVAFKRYGGAGIVMCEEWRNSFEAFFAYMGDRPQNSTLDRIDNSKGYQPDNCRWASKKEQSQNSSWPKLISHNGLTMNIREWERHFGYKAGLVQRRLLNGWDIKRALDTPPCHLRVKGFSPK